MIDPTHNDLRLSSQCKLLCFARSSLYYRPRPPNEETLGLMNRIDDLFTQHPFLGTRRMVELLKDQGVMVGRRRVRSLMRKMGIEAIHPGPKTSKPQPGHKTYPYLLRDLTIERPDQVWCADITYIRMRRGHLYLGAVMDWYSRKVLSWRVSNTLEADFCVEALREAMERYGAPKIFNTDQGGQFTGHAFTGVLADHGIRISMDGKGRWMDNVFIERLWRSVKYECTNLHAFNTAKELKAGLTDWFRFYNDIRPHMALNYRKPADVYAETGGA